MKTLLAFMLSLSLCAAIVSGVNYASADRPADYVVTGEASEHVLVAKTTDGDTVTIHDPVEVALDSRPILLAQADAPSDAELSPTATSSPTTDAPTALPNPAEQPQASAGLLFKLYKAGHLVPMLIVASFFLLLLLQKWIAWLRTGYRKLLVASALGSLGMLAERVADGTTPNLMMIMGAAGVGLAMWMKTEGAPQP